jgi:hypothetical protein
MKKKSLCIVLVCGLLIFSMQLKAQIIYTDINPDTTLSPPPGSGYSYSIDLNKDLNGDFLIQVNNMSPGYESVKISGNKILFQVAGNGDTLNIEDFHPLAFELHDTISDKPSILWYNYWDTAWQHGLPFSIAGYGINGTGNWTGGTTGKYIGARMKITGNWHYGWIGLDIPAAANACTIRDIAFESTPYKAILAGNTSSGISDKAPADNVSIYIQQHILFINTKENTPPSGIIIYDCNGRIVKSIYTNRSELKINIDGITPGIYVLSVLTNNGIVNKKIVIY